MLIVAAYAPAQPAVLTEALERFKGRGAHVALACFFDPAVLNLDPALADAQNFAATAETITPRFRTALGRAQPNRKIWLHAQRSAWLRQQARDADLLVAVDPKSLHTVWELAQRNLRAGAHYGLVPALKALDAGAFGALPVPRLVERQVSAAASMGVRGARRMAVQSARTSLRRATGARVMRNPAGAWFWTQAVGAPRVPDRVRNKLALRVYDSAVRADRLAAAARTSAAAVRKLRNLQYKADLLVKGAQAEFGLGRVPTVLHEAINANLQLADLRYGQGNIPKAVAALSAAWTLASNRVLHFDRLTSPIATDVQGHLGAFANSPAAQQLYGNNGRRTPAAPPPTDRPLRILLTTLINDNFLHEIRQRYEDMPNVEVRFLDLNADEERRPLTRSASSVMEYRLSGSTPFGDKIEEWLRPHVDWADVVFVDWCQATAALFTMLDPGTTRMIIRLHSFEAFNLWPHLVDWTRVDDLVFVSEHLRDLGVAVLPKIAEEGGPRLWVLDNAMDLQRFPKPKPAEARFNVGLVGVGSVAKDSRWAIEVLRHLRAADERYHLLLIGSDLNNRTSAAAKEYGALLKKDLAELEPSGAVQRRGQTDDVPGALTEVGVILSSSVRESFHCGLVEGAASGAVPVVRDWPFFAGKPHGARTLFPADWVVATPEEAAKRILDATATEERWRELGQEAAELSLRTWDWSVTHTGFDRLFLEP
ncbi:glycosyltransferase family 1 protein [Asanoa sp. NPDC050611]|uniref:glycosyltransferase family 1 protein n=1 Tax=Asanoa sp. NPDC050611 TaxID=3157098 RepID=UPI0033DB3DF1